ncbi:LysR family transcriptional regulator [Sporolactobacillus shoreicorticis]|uniref:LysR family transcriptional regulator n=1 Tax=Sporolactobacillus shoreicorticis TaxID=1923877 RepID=A0ABW5RZR2_9BACL|nr:LysR family transcriptional regulator [Sporolactobacillus shoreicorticis]MCO7126792.1 LysR family transcriptional regulator [Sporolactobacillus shoreicorticis]
MSLIKYQILTKVIEFNSFTRAADHLGLTQSAVSHAITNLEQEFGFQLINRNRVGLSLTHEGDLLLPSINAVLQMDETLHQEASAILGVKKGTVSVGVFTSVCRHLLPQIVERMDKLYPLVKIRLFDGNYEEIEQALIRGELDCGFVTKTEIKSVCVTPLKKDRMLCIVSPKSPLYNQKKVAFKQIEDEPFIMPAFGGFHEIKRLLSEHQCTPAIRFELMEENAILAMVAHHLGISILPELVLPENIKPLRAIPFTVDRFRTIGLASRIPASPAAQCFADIVRELIHDDESASG